MKYLFGSIAALLLLAISCTPPLVFTAAQPKGVKNQDAFQLHYQGTYFCTGDSSIVRVEENTLYKEKSFTFVTSLAELDAMEDVYFEEGKIYRDDQEMPFEVLYLDDQTLAGTYTHRDTLFRVGPQQILKFYKGHHLLNTRINEKHWQLWLLSKDQLGNLVLSKTKLPERMSKLEAITPVKDIAQDTERPQFEINPTKAEFKKLLQTRLIFEECDYYEWIRPQLNF